MAIQAVEGGRHAEQHNRQMRPARNERARQIGRGAVCTCAG